MKFLLSLVSVTLASAAEWAVLVAGSNTYSNYRHQADIAHAYKVVKDFGIPDERIITMIYDDLAQDRENPFKGQIFNKPTAVGEAGVDVYAGLKIDYRGKDVNSKNFLAVLTGDSATTAGKPVLKSTGEDNVFINFDDHGGVGLICFPTENLSSKQLNDALKTMHTKNMFKKLVFYLETCEAGSMFEGLVDPSMGIYATTAANAEESSWGTFCPPDDFVNGKAMNTCLGDLYSVNWMENSKAVGTTESLDDQFTAVLKATDKSHVSRYGDMTYVSEPIGDFMGNNAPKNTTAAPAPSASSSNVAAPDIPMHLMYYKYLRAEGLLAQGQALKELQAVLARRAQIDTIFATFADRVSKTMNTKAEDVLTATPKAPASCDECCQAVRATFTTRCGGYEDYVLKYSRVFVNVCANGQDGQKLASILDNVCNSA